MPKYSQLAVHQCPRFSDIIIADSGEFLGWHLGSQAASRSFSAPIKKFVNRVHEICLGKAPTAVSLIRYNQRVLPVLSYVSQFAIPPDSFHVNALAHRSIHSILRIPPNSFSVLLTNTIGFCSMIDPLPISAYCGWLGTGLLSAKHLISGNSDRVSLTCWARMPLLAALQIGFPMVV